MAARRRSSSLVVLSESQLTSQLLEKLSAKVNCMTRMTRGSSDWLAPASISAEECKDSGATAFASCGNRATSYNVFLSHQCSDEATMLRLKEVLEQNGLTVGTVPTVDNTEGRFVGRAEQFLCNSELFLCLANESTSEFRYCIDEMCLAYVRKMPIYIVSLQPKAEVCSRFVTSTRLIAARSDWTIIREESFRKDVEGFLVKKLKEKLHKNDIKETEEE